MTTAGPDAARLSCRAAETAAGPRGYAGATLRVLAALLLTTPLLFFALPPQRCGPLVLVALVPLLVALHRTRWTIGLVVGPALMLALGAPYALGIAPPILDRPMPGAGLVLCVIFGTTFGLPLAVAAEGSWSIRNVIVICALAVCAEGLLFLFVPGHLALALAREPVALALASVGSIWAVTFACWWTNMTLAAWIVRRERRYVAALLAVLPVIGLAWGHTRLIATPGRPTIAVVAIQTSTTHLYSDWESLHLLASEPRGGVAPAMVVWPELSGASIVAGSTDPLVRLARMPGSAPFATTFRTRGPDLPYNTAAIFSPDGVSPYYFKRHPYADERLIHTAGTEAATVTCGGVDYGLAICFDSCFPASMRETARTPSADEGARPDMILLPTLDPPDHTGIIQAMHAAFTPYRAAETGCPIVRADITSRSMIVGPRGEILAEAGSGDAVIRAAAPKATARLPIAMYVGDGVLHACILVVASSLVVVTSRRLRRPS